MFVCLFVFLQSPCCAGTCLQHICSSGQGATGAVLCVTGPLCHRAIVSQAHCMVCVSQGRSVTAVLCVTGPLCHRAVLSQQFYVSQGRCVIGPLCHRHTVWSVCHRAVLSQQFYVSQGRCVIGPFCHSGSMCHRAIVS